MEKNNVKTEFKRIASELGKVPTRIEFKKFSRISYYWVVKLFETYESLKVACKLSDEGLKSEIETMKQYKAHRREKNLKQLQAKYYEKLEKQKIIQEECIKAIDGAIAMIQPDQIEVKRMKDDITKGNQDAKAAILWLDISDCQIGTLVERKSIGELNEHDWSVWQKKLEIYKQAVIEKIREVRDNYNLREVKLAFLGDIVEGSEIFRDQKNFIDANVFIQTFEGANDLGKMILSLAGTFPQLKFKAYAVAGNHGRVGFKGENPFHVNFDQFLYKYMENKLYVEAKEKNLTNIDFNFNITWFELISVFKGYDGPMKETGWINLIIHGDDIKMHYGIPFYGIARSGAKYDKMLMKHIQYRHLGHFHQPAELTNFAGIDLINGCWPGDTEFSLKTLNSSTRPLQKGFLFTPEDGIVESYNFYLEEYKKPAVRVL